VDLHACPALIPEEVQEMTIVLNAEAEPPSPGDETQLVDISLGIVAKSVVTAKRPDEADIS
jgi:hypothetical protein